MNNSSAEVLIEVKSILEANTLVQFVGIDKVEPLASETNQVAVYIQHSNLVPKSLRNSTETIGYDYHGFYNLIINVDGASDNMLIYDTVDSIQRSILNDTAIWGKSVNRTIITIEYDNAEFYPKRSAIIALEVVFRLKAN